MKPVANMLTQFTVSNVTYYVWKCSSYGLNSIDQIHISCVCFTPQKHVILLNNHTGTHAPGRVFTCAEGSSHIHSVSAAFHCAVAERDLVTTHTHTHTHFNTDQLFTSWFPSDDPIQQHQIFLCLCFHSHCFNPIDICL